MQQQAESPATAVSFADELRPLLERAQGGDASALGPLRAAIEREGLWKKLGDLSWHVEESLLREVASSNILLHEALRCHLARLREELAPESATPLERLLASRVALCWAMSHLADTEALAKDQGAGAQGPHAQRRQDAAHRRLLTAARQLAWATKLLRRAPSPFQVSAVLAGQQRKAFACRDASLVDGVPVEN
jgi:hypothetical protein